MKMKIISGPLQADDLTEKIKKNFEKKHMKYENAETRLNDFIQDKKIIEIKSYVTESFWSNPKITFVVYYSD